MDIYDARPVYEKEIHYNSDRQEKIMLTINTFKGTEYLHLRKYYQDFDEAWKPTKDGIAMPLDFDNSRNLFSALVEILSLSEVKGVLENHFKDILDDIYL